MEKQLKEWLENQLSITKSEWRATKFQSHKYKKLRLEKTQNGIEERIKFLETLSTFLETQLNNLK
jgi:hypothetical protein